MSDLIEARGQIIRVASSNLGYILLDGSNEVVSFNAAALSSGASTVNIAILHRRVFVQMRNATAEVLGVQVDDATVETVRAVKLADILRPLPVAVDAKHYDLHPDRDAVRYQKMERALPHGTRSFGKIIDTANLRPGDLLLSRSINPDSFSELVTQVQEQGGYDATHARWTHAAMYVGDDFHVVEATFERITSGGNVRLTSLDSYCTGSHAIRFRRPINVGTDQARWRLCVRALSRLTDKYDFLDAALMWFQVMIRKQGFWDELHRRSAVSAAVICSTLYADSFNEATRRSLGEIGGVCVPAWLSGSSEFEDLDVGWLAIR